MTNLEREASDPTPEASELEGGGTGQNWGQGEGAHEPTITDDPEDEANPLTYSGGTTAELDHKDQPLAREHEGMDR